CARENDDYYYAMDYW
nr:immunoglobulin heavy chain junction region [Mus musculus]